MSNFNTSSGFGFKSTEEGLYHSINLYSNANVTFSFQAPLAWQVSFYVLYGGPSPLPMTATYGTQTKTISASNTWQQVTLGPLGPGRMTLALATQALPAGAEIVISNLQIGSYPINLELWFANQNEPLAAWVDNLADKNYALQIANNAMVAANGPTIGTSDFTIEMWLLPAGAGPIASFGVGQMAQCPAVMMLRIGGGGSLSFQVAGQDGLGGGLVTTAGPTAILDGEWHHVAAVRSGTTLSLWLDREQVASANATAASLQQPYPIYLGYEYLLGRNELKAPSYLTGAFDELRLLEGGAFPDAD